MKVQLLKMGNLKIYVFIIFCLVLSGNSLVCFATGYPIEIKVISKSEAIYDSPENAYTAMISSLLHEDIEWHYKTLTQESVEEEIALQEKYGYNPQKIFDSVKSIKKIAIRDSNTYKNGILLIVRTVNQDGSIFEGPAFFVQENGLWKSSQLTLSSDAPILDLIEYTPPPQYLTPFNASIYPSQWPLPWYSWIAEQIEQNSWAEQIADSMTMLCVISDQEGDDFSVSDILPETLRLNNVLVPQPWRYFSWRTFSWEEKDTILFPATNHPVVSGRIFEQWREQLPLSNNEGQRMMVRFNLYQALQTLPDMEAGETYELTLSGMLEGDKPFKTTADISIINSFQQPESDWRWWRQNPPHHSELFENWWNR